MPEVKTYGDYRELEFRAQSFLRQPIRVPTIAFADGWPAPDALDETGIAAVIRAFVDAARRALAAGFAIVALCAFPFLLPYAQVLLEQTAQSVACNRRHEMDERFARRLRVPVRAPGRRGIPWLRARRFRRSGPRPLRHRRG